MAEETVRGFLLSRQWRDFAAGIELSFWACSERGPLRITVPQQSAVCFIDRDQAIELPAGARRTSVNLKSTRGNPVDALYFKAQKDLGLLHRTEETTELLHESDVKPADRYLMERFVCAGFVAQGTVVEHQGYVEMHSPRLKPFDYQPDITLASIDIETRGMSDQLYSIALHSGVMRVVLMVGEDNSSKPDAFELRMYKSEKLLLESFFHLIHEVNPDIIIGWNVVGFDLDFIARKCRALNIRFQMGRGDDASTILQIGDASPVKIARIPGRSVLDGVDMLRAAFWSFESFSLENVGQELLGRGKTISGVNKVEQINRLYQTDKLELARYNIEDAVLVTEIFKAADLLNFAMQRAQMTGLPLDKTGGAVQTFDNLYLPRLHRKGYVAADAGQSESSSPGGYVLDSSPGLYRNVIVLDFKSLYPSIIKTFLIDPLGLCLPGDDPVPGYDGATFSRHAHILPDLIETLWAKRDEAKANNNTAMSQAIKIIMNSLYGVLGSAGCRFHDHKLASSITKRGHEIILKSQSFIESTGWTVIYGDTDSLFVLLDESFEDKQARAVGHELQIALNSYWQKHIRESFVLESHLEIEFETLYTRFVMPTVRSAQGGVLENTGSKKRYAGLVSCSNGSTQLVFKGLEAVRTDWTLLARDFQRELYEKIFTDHPVEDLVRNTTGQLLSGALDQKLVYRKRLRRKLSDYQRNVPPHVQAARKSATTQKWVSYVQTVAGPEPLDAITADIDYLHYVEKQLIPVADGILHFLNTSYHSVMSEQAELF